MKLNINHKKIRKGLLMLCLLPMAIHAEAANQRSDNVELQAVWELLDDARKYRQDWFVGSETGKVGKSHKELITAYSDSEDYCNTITAQDCFILAANKFRDIIMVTGNSLLLEEASWGLQESLNEYMAGQSLIGNDYLIKGLRVRFPIQNSGGIADLDQLTSLTYSEEQLSKGMDEVAEDVRLRTEIMRKGEPGFPAPYFVENSIPKNTQTVGQLVESELYRFTHLVQRAALAANSKAKRMFFFGNVKDVDNFPYLNFPGSEDVDLNGDGVKNSAGRIEASQKFKESAHRTYMHSVLLAAIQSEDEFFDNDGYTLKRQVTDAERVFDDIKQGFNPLKLQGDFVPFQPVENFMRLARERVSDAALLEKEAKETGRRYDIDQTQLKQTLLAMKNNYFDKIQQLTGLDPQPYNLPKERNSLVVTAKLNAEKGSGALGIQLLNIKEVEKVIENAHKRILAVGEQVATEQARHSAVATLVLETGEKMSALTFVESMASSAASSALGIPIVGEAFSWLNNSATLSAGTSAAKAMLSAVERAQIDGIESAARIKNLMIEAVVLAGSVEEARIALQRETARYNELLADLDRTIDNYGQSRDDLAGSYLNNPAYRLEKDQLFEAAETSFETAIVESYYAAKALEYLWSEKFNNPVLRVDGGLPESLSVSFDPYIRAESVFSSRFSDSQSPSVGNFLNALQAWDVKMRQFRAPAMQQSTVNISLRKDILKFDSDDQDFDRLLFKNFISQNRIAGKNNENDDLELEFSIQISDESIFPNYPNIKIQDISINLVSGNQSIRGVGGVEPVLVDLVQLDKSMVRSFFAGDMDDDLLIYELEEGRTLEKSPFNASVEATVDNYAYPQPSANVQLAGHSPAVTRWMLRIKMNRKPNESLDISSLEDIELKVGYYFGKPRDVTF